LAGVGPADGALLDVMAARLTRLSGEPVSPALWDVSVLPPHLTVRFEVRAGNRRLADGRDLERLRHDLQAEVRAALGRAAPELITHGQRSWAFGDIPAVIERGPVRAFPAMVDEGDGVGLALLDTPEAQADSMWQATRRLVRLAVPLAVTHLQRQMTNETKLALTRSSHPLASLFDDSATAVIDQIVVARGGPPFTASGFEELAAATRRDLADRVTRVATIAGGVMAAAELVLSAADRLEARHPSGPAASAAADVRDQVERLVHPGFVTETGTLRLRDLFRYLDAAGQRLGRLPGDGRRDAERQAAVERVQHRYESLLDRLVSRPSRPGAGVGLSAIRWMIEELRVSLWAQQLGTAGAVSEARIARALDRLEAPGRI
jgi:ATP-dependent helicase HrpA